MASPCSTVGWLSASVRPRTSRERSSRNGLLPSKRRRALLGAVDSCARAGSCRVRLAARRRNGDGDRLRRALLPRRRSNLPRERGRARSRSRRSTPRRCRFARPPPRSAGSSEESAGGTALAFGGYTAVGLVPRRTLRGSGPPATRGRSVHSSGRSGHATRPAHLSTRSGSCSGSLKARPEPATRSRTVEETRTSPGSARALQSARDQTGGPLEKIAAERLLARVEAGPCRPADRAREAQQRRRAADRARGAVEHGDQRVAP